MKQIMPQAQQKTTFIDITAPDDTYNIAHERVTNKVLGLKVPHVRLNMLSVQAKPFTVDGCDDGCAIPGETVETVRIIVSGPTFSKQSLISKLEAMLGDLKSDKLQNVWEGLPPNPNTTLELVDASGA